MKDLNTKSTKELVKMLTEKKGDLQGFRFGNAGSKSRNVKEGRTIKKDIARIMTALSATTKEDAKMRAANKSSEKAASK